LSTEGFNPLKKAFAVDISEDALKIAKKNIKTYNLSEKIELLKSDLLENINLSTEGFSPLNYIITANLPYIKNEDF
jgi:release factor glutamine methyltransferase